MDGFGASFMEAGAIVLNSLPIEKQEEVLKFIFDQETGVGFSAAKTPIAATDFMCAGPWYSYDEVPGDVNLDHFTVKRDLHANGTLTLLKRAKKYSKELKIQATMDYPPDWMFSGDLPMAEVPERYFPAIANYYLRFLQEYEKNGV
jgi:O-glycosyl hydrolase